MNRVAGEPVRVVSVGMAAGDGEHPLADQVREHVPDLLRYQASDQTPAERLDQSVDVLGGLEQHGAAIRTRLLEVERGHERLVGSLSNRSGNRTDCAIVRSVTQEAAEDGAEEHRLKKGRGREKAMRITILTILTAGAIGTSSIYGQDQPDRCLELLRYSRTISQTLMSETQFDIAKSNFCSEYQESRAAGRSANYGGSYELLSVSMGTASNSDQNVASKYCADSEIGGGTSADFQQYLTGIDPGAYSAYSACVNARTSGVEVRLLGNATRDRLEVLVSFVTDNADDEADLMWTSSTPVTCRSDVAEGGDPDSQRFRLSSDERTLLVCSRDNPRADPRIEADYVNVVRRNGNAAVSIAWQKYNENGTPINTMEAVQDSLARLSAELSMLKENAIIVTDQECGSLGDWEPYAGSAGRIPIGAGTGSDVNGVIRRFAIGDDSVGEYVHTLSLEEMPVHDHGYGGSALGGGHECNGTCRRMAPVPGTTTDQAGEGRPHNNMPPTFAMNFCIHAQ